MRISQTAFLFNNLICSVVSDIFLIGVESRLEYKNATIAEIIKQISIGEEIIQQLQQSSELSEDKVLERYAKNKAFVNLTCGADICVNRPIIQWNICPPNRIENLISGQRLFF